MGDKKTSEEKQANKCSLKCKTCEHYNRVSDYCREKAIKHCSKQVHTDFSTCNSYLISEKLVMF